MAQKISSNDFIALSATTVTLVSISETYQFCTIYLYTDTGSTASIQIEGSPDGRHWASLGDAIELGPNSTSVYVNDDYIPFVRVLGAQVSGAASDANAKVIASYRPRSMNKLI